MVSDRALPADKADSSETSSDFGVGTTLSVSSLVFSGSGGSVPARQRTVLVLDAEDAWRRKFSRGLARLGHRIFQAGQLDEAKDAINACVPDIIIADLESGKRAGLALYQAVRRFPEVEHIPFLFTGRGPCPLELVTDVPMDASAYLRKPYTVRRAVAWARPLFARLDRLEHLGSLCEFQGDFEGLQLCDILGVLVRYRATGTLEIRHGGPGNSATVVYKEGCICRAVNGELSGAEVFFELALWQGGSYSFSSALSQEPMDCSRDDPDADHLSETLRVIDRGRMNPFPFPRTRLRDDAPLLEERGDALDEDSELFIVHRGEDRTVFLVEKVDETTRQARIGGRLSDDNTLEFVEGGTNVLRRPLGGGDTTVEMMSEDEEGAPSAVVEHSGDDETSELVILEDVAHRPEDDGVVTDPPPARGQRRSRQVHPPKVEPIPFAPISRHTSALREYIRTLRTKTHCTVQLHDAKTGVLATTFHRPEDINQMSALSFAIAQSSMWRTNRFSLLGMDALALEMDGYLVVQIQIADGLYLIARRPMSHDVDFIQNACAGTAAYIRQELGIG